MLFIDEAATYWNATVGIPDGAHIEVSGDYPHARYMSLVTYDVRASTIHHMADTAIEPDAGSTNPFLPGAVRTAPDRHFTLRVVNERVPAAGPAPNTLYTENADGSRSTRANGEARLTLRIYAPDEGTDEAGDAPLPEITVVLASGERIPLPSCLDATAPAAETGFSVPGGLGSNPPTWARFLPNGLGENVDNSYVYETFMPSYGEVLVLRSKAPTFPTTREGDPEMGGGQVRYWSLCSNLLTTAVLECLQDEDVPLDDQGNYTIVVSRPDARPANATPECGVAWVPADPRTDTMLVYRHMLPDPSFPEAIQNVQPGTEAQTMGEYLPAGTYYENSAAFERLGCERSAATEVTAAAEQETTSDRVRGTPTTLWLLPVVALGLGAVAIAGLRRRRSARPGVDVAASDSTGQ